MIAWQSIMAAFLVMVLTEFDINNYDVPAASLEREIVINKSRFIAWLRPVQTRDQALEEVAKARAAYPDASHHCYAYLLGNPASAQAAMNDDGEPSGTAGKPMFNVIQHKDLSDVLVIVSRYFGGVKLGAGGLVRAYAGAAEAVLSQVERLAHQPSSRLRLGLDFSQEQPLRHWAGTHGAQVEEVSYAQQVSMVLTVPDEQLSALQSLCDAQGVIMDSLD